MIHSKVMIVDDILLRVGSANLNNRSLGLDTECDLAFEARQRRRIASRIAGIRDRMLGHFCGVAAAEVAAALVATRSLIETAQTLTETATACAHRTRQGRSRAVSTLEECRRSRAPIEAPAFLQEFRRRSARGRGASAGSSKVIGIGLVIVRWCWRGV